MILMKLSHSPKNAGQQKRYCNHQIVQLRKCFYKTHHFTHFTYKLFIFLVVSLHLAHFNTSEKWYGSSPGSSSSSGSSWSSGSSSPPLSDDGHAGLNTSAMLTDPSTRIRTTSVSTSDEGIVVDFKEEAPRKKRVSTWR